jgi:lysozyme family protein
MAWLFTREGGYQNHREDIGNWTGGAVDVGELKGTKYGISAASYPELDIKNLTKRDASQLYHHDYWLASQANTYSWPLSLLVFDTAVLHGVGAAQSWISEVGTNPYAFAAKRLRVYTNSRNWKHFGAGWVNRTADLLKEMST